MWLYTSFLGKDCWFYISLDNSKAELLTLPFLLSLKPFDIKQICSMNLSRLTRYFPSSTKKYFFLLEERCFSEDK